MDENQSILAWIKSHAVLAAVFVGLLLGAIVLMFKQQPGASTASPTATATGDLSGLATDANGNHIVYVPVQNSYENIYAPTTTVTSTPAPAPQPPPKTPRPGQQQQQQSSSAALIPLDIGSNGTFQATPIVSNVPIPMGDGGDPSSPPFGAHAALSPQPPRLAPGDPGARGMWTGTYMTSPGDTLESVAKARSAHGVQTSWIDLYVHNRVNLHALHGQVIRPHQPLVPGTVLSVPRS
jgi:hypothetical protein